MSFLVLGSFGLEISLMMGWCIVLLICILVLMVSFFCMV